MTNTLTIDTKSRTSRHLAKNEADCTLCTVTMKIPETFHIYVENLQQTILCMLALFMPIIHTPPLYLHHFLSLSLLFIKSSVFLFRAAQCIVIQKLHSTEIQAEINMAKASRRFFCRVIIYWNFVGDELTTCDIEEQKPRVRAFNLNNWGLHQSIIVYRRRFSTVPLEPVEPFHSIIIIISNFNHSCFLSAFNFLPRSNFFQFFTPHPISS